jgi:HEAT repeat protein
VNEAGRFSRFLVRLVLLFSAAGALCVASIIKWGVRNLVLLPGLIVLLLTWGALLIHPRTRRIVRGGLVSSFLTLVLLTLLGHMLIARLMPRRKLPRERNWSVEAVSPTGRYEAVLWFRSGTGPHSLVQSGLRIRNVSRPQSAVAFPDPNRPIFNKGSVPNHIFFSPYNENNVFWSSRENALAVVGPDRRGVLYAFHEGVANVHLALNLDGDTLRDLDLGDEPDIKLLRYAAPVIGIFPWSEMHGVKTAVAADIPEWHAETVIARELGVSPELLGAMPAAPFETDMPVGMARAKTNSAQSSEKYAAYHSLWRNQITDWCVSALADPDPVVRWWAAATVGAYPKAEPIQSEQDLVVSRLAECLTTQDESLLGAAWWALRKMKPGVGARSVEAWQVYRLDRSEAVSFLLEALERGRVSAVTPLAELEGESAIEPLLEVWQNRGDTGWNHQVGRAIARLSGYPDIHWYSPEAARAFWTMCRRSRTEDIARALDAPQVWVRQAALLALGRRKGDTALRILQEADANDFHIKGSRERALERREQSAMAFDEEPDTPASVMTCPELEQLWMETMNPAYVEELERRGAEGLPHLIQCFRRWRPDLESWKPPPFFDHVVAYENEALPTLIAGAQSQDWPVAYWSIKALDRVQRPESIPVLFDLAARPKKGQINRSARCVLGRKWAAPYAVDFLVAAATDENPAIREAVLAILMEGFRFPDLDPEVRRMITALLLAGAEDSASEVRHTAVRALTDFARAGLLEKEPAVPVLQKRVDDPNDHVALLAIGGLQILGQALGDYELKSLSRIASGTDDRLRSSAVSGLCALNTGKARAIVVLLAEDPNPKVRGMVARYVAEISDATAREVLIQLSRDPDRDVRRFAAIGCRADSLSAETKQGILTTLIKDPDQRVREEAEISLDR